MEIKIAEYANYIYQSNMIGVIGCGILTLVTIIILIVSHLRCVIEVRKSPFDLGEEGVSLFAVIFLGILIISIIMVPFTYCSINVIKAKTSPTLLYEAHLKGGKI